VADGAVVPAVHAVRPLAEITEAFGDLLARRNAGKIVLEVAP
jgi:NADPH:quinone reductase-like Zn-dependent oxidoreductase